MESPKNCVTQIKNQLQEISTDLKLIREDSSFRDWEQVDLEKHSSILESFGISIKHILETNKKIKRGIVSPAREIAKLENNIGHIAVDIETGDIEEIKAKQQCKIIGDETSNNAEAIKTIQQELIFLQDAAKTIRKKLTLDNLIPMAQKISVGKKAKHFSTGLSYLSMLGEKTDNGNINIRRLLEETAQLETKFTRLEYPELPSLAETILANHVHTCLSSVSLIIQYLERSAHAGDTNLKAIEKFTKHIASYTTQPLTNILEAIPDLAEKLRDLICDLQHYSMVIEKIEKVNQLIESMNTLYVALKYDYLEYLSKQIKQSSSIAPRVTASQITLDYFGGVKGLVRNFRLMLGGLDRGEAKPDIYLSNLLVTTIKTCSHYCGTGKTAISKITSFIDNQLADCPKPFPYDDFFKITKKTIVVYGENVERDFYHYKIYSSASQYTNESLPKNDSTNKSRTTFGRVLGKIDLLAQELKKSLTQPEE
jgi:hypothetical protein